MVKLGNAPLLSEARKAKRKPNIVLQILIFIAVFLSSSVITGIIIVPIMVIEIFKSVNASLIAGGDAANVFDYAMEALDALPEWFSVLMLFLTAAGTICAIIYCLKIEGRSLASMGMRKKGFLKNYGCGYLIGIIMISAAAGLSMLLGGSRFTGFCTEVSWLYVGLFFLGFLLQGMSEEVLVRGYFMVSCANVVHLTVAVALSSVLFAALHLANSGITIPAFINLCLYGVFMAVYMLRNNDLWGACAIHSSWNFVQGHILGISVSGTSVSNSVFSTDFIEGKELISGGSFGIEGGICTSIVLLVAIVLALMIPKKTHWSSPESSQNIDIA